MAAGTKSNVKAPEINFLKLLLGTSEVGLGQTKRGTRGFVRPKQVSGSPDCQWFSIQPRGSFYLVSFNWVAAHMLLCPSSILALLLFTISQRALCISIRRTRIACLHLLDADSFVLLLI